MLLCVAQVRSFTHALSRNIRTHLRIAELASELGATLVVFPELSLVNYGTAQAPLAATTPEDPIFDPIVDLCQRTGMTLAVGMPLRSPGGGVEISLLIVHPDRTVEHYSKQHLHSDETPHFVPGHRVIDIQLQHTSIALGICYETLQREHFVQSVDRGAEVYIASVAKPERGMHTALKYFPTVAREFHVPILLSNCVGQCEDFLAAGQSTVWSSQGDALAGLGRDTQGVLLFDTETERATAIVECVVQAQETDLDAVVDLYQSASDALTAAGINQWNRHYPTRGLLREDILRGHLYLMKMGHILLGAVCLSGEQEDAYQQVNWLGQDISAFIIHRLVVDPRTQGLGVATHLMDFAEDVARARRYTAIRLDVYSENPAAVRLYERRGYAHRGQVYFPKRTHPFICMEKQL